MYSVQPKAWLTPLIDIITLVIYGTLYSSLTVRMLELKVRNGIIIIAVYLLMCVFLFLSRSLDSKPKSKGRDPGLVRDPEAAEQTYHGENLHGSKDSRFGWVFFLSWAYSAFVVVMAAETSGVFRSETALGARFENLGHDSGLILIPTGLVFFGLLVLFPLALLRDPKKKWKFGTARHTAVRSLTTLSVNAMMLLNALFWSRQLADAEPLEMAIGGKLLVFALSYIVFLMFYAPPRLALLSLESSRWSFTGYAVFLGITVWRLMG